MLRSSEQRFTWNRVSPRRSFPSPSRGPLHLDESIFEPEISDIPLAILGKMSSQGVFPLPLDATPTRATHGSLSGGTDVPLALPPSSKACIAHTTTPLPSDVVEHWQGLTAIRFPSGGRFRRRSAILRIGRGLRGRWGGRRGEGGRDIPETRC